MHYTMDALESKKNVRKIMEQTHREMCLPEYEAEFPALERAPVRF